MTVDWLADLERAVMAAREQLVEVRKENRVLKARLQKLEKELKEVSIESEPSEDWEEQGRIVRRRVAKLADGLERLLDN